MTSRRVLIVDDHVEMARVLADRLVEEGWTAHVVDSGKAAIDALRTRSPDVVITDLRMEDVDGLDVLDAAHQLDPQLPVIIMTAFGAIESAIEAMKRGAWHYIAKPARLDELVLHANRAFEHRSLLRENHLLRVQTRRGLAPLVGTGRAMRELAGLIDRIALASSPVLIRGESGTGKELVARAIHDSGPRRDRPFVAINCTALPEALLESELFGHTRGAFTGATNSRAGLFVEADGGTLFLDEIGDMPLALQAKLLRVLQGGEVRAVGSDENRVVDVRIVAATHQDLDRRVEEGTFRQDLFYRLDVVPVEVPPLRERIEDLAPLVAHFHAVALERNKQSPLVRLAPEVLTALARYPWPGNVRELENLIERLVVVATVAELTLSDLLALAPHLVQERFAFARDRIATLAEIEAEYITWVIEKCGGNKRRAAEALGIDPSTIHRRARRR